MQRQPAGACRLSRQRSQFAAGVFWRGAKGWTGQPAAAHQRATSLGPEGPGECVATCGGTERPCRGWWSSAVPLSYFKSRSIGADGTDGTEIFACDSEASAQLLRGAGPRVEFPVPSALLGPPGHGQGVSGPAVRGWSRFDPVGESSGQVHRNTSYGTDGTDVCIYEPHDSCHRHRVMRAHTHTPHGHKAQVESRQSRLL